ncbi:MAG: DUF4157 domain-containing protein [Ferruginibacter sp.]|nr:DUF4157 domain-containing protein [Ferruginibacter sp.]
MKSANIRRRYRRSAAKEAVASKKENQSEQQFFGETTHEPFFKPAMAVQQNLQRKCADCEKEDKVQRSPETKEEEKVMKKEEKKEEKVQRTSDKKEEEKKVQKKGDQREEEKVMKKEEKKEEEKVNKKEDAASTNSTTTTASNYISSINGKGQSMDAGVQSFYENRIGADFSDVKIHTGKEAADSAKDINAQAYAYGNHIVFNEGKYQPQTSEGKHLLAHELAHVVQQLSGNKQVNRISCGETPPTAPPRVAQGQRNTIDARAQAIIDIAADATVAASTRAVNVVSQIICQYFPGEAAKVDSVIYNAAEGGLDTSSIGSGATTTGRITVGDYFLTNTDSRNFARRVLQVGHEIDHINQYRTGLAGHNNRFEREFLAHYNNAIADEFEGTGRMSRSTRLNIIDGALDYYLCISTALQTQYATHRSTLRTSRQALIDTGRVGTPPPEPTACTH